MVFRKAFGGLSCFLPALLALQPAISRAQPGKEGSAIKQGPQSELIEIVDHHFPEEIAMNLSRPRAGWLPYYVELRSLEKRAILVELVGEVISRDRMPRNVPFTTRRRIEVSPGAPTRTWLYFHYQGSDNSTFRIRPVILVKGKPQSLPDKDLYFGLDEDIVPMFVSGEHTGASVSPWGGSKLGRINPRGIVRVEEKALPDQPFGYSTVSLLILRNPDFKVMEPAQIDAIRKWVFLGGWVILVPSPKGEIFRSSLLRDLLPRAEIGELQLKTGFVPRGLWSIGSGGESQWIEEVPPLENVSYTILDPVQVEVTREIISGAMNREGPGDRPPLDATRLYYEVGYGAGRVGVMAFDDMAFGEPSLPFRRILWGQILEGTRVRDGAGPSWRRQEVFQKSLAGEVQKGLTREIGVSFIVILVLGYLIVIGPGLYMILRRMRRLPAIVWVEPLVVLVYLGIIALTAYVTKGVLTRTRTLTVLEHSREAPVVVRNCFLGIFSAGETRYRISAPGESVILPVEEGGGSFQDLKVNHALQGPELEEFRIPQWGTTTFATWSIDDVPPDFGLEIEIKPLPARGVETAESLTLRNRTGLFIRRGFLISSGKTYLVKSIPAGKEVVMKKPFLPVEFPKKTKEAPEEADPFGGDQLLEGAVSELIARGNSSHQLFFIGEVEREEEDFAVDRPSTLEHRVDLFVEYHSSHGRWE